MPERSLWARARRVLKAHANDALGQLHRQELRVMRAALGEQPIPLHWWRRRASILAAVSQRSGVPAGAPEDVLLPGELAPELAGCCVGGWLMDRRSIRFLLADLAARQPATLVEVGSGTSTVALASHVAAERSRGRQVQLLSVEQSEEYARRTRQTLVSRGLEGLVRLVTVPLRADGAFQSEGLREAVGRLAQPVEWVLIDGPFGPPGCRRTTLTALLASCRAGARWFLDDALRRPELQLLEEWTRDPRVVLEGIVPVGQGIAAGTVSS